MSETKIKNLWGDLPIEDNVRTPYIILKEQASILTKATNGLLIGEVTKRRLAGDYTECNLIIKVPSINNYTISIVNMIYPAIIYPLKVKGDFTKNIAAECNTEEELENVLHKILSSAEVKRIVSGLLSEVRADEE